MFDVFLSCIFSMPVFVSVDASGCIGRCYSGCGGSIFFIYLSRSPSVLTAHMMPTPIGLATSYM